MKSLRALHEAARSEPWATDDDAEAFGDDAALYNNRNTFVAEHLDYRDAAITVALRNHTEQFIALWEAADAAVSASKPCACGGSLAFNKHTYPILLAAVEALRDVMEGDSDGNSRDSATTRNAR